MGEGRQLLGTVFVRWRRKQFVFSVLLFLFFFVCVSVSDVSVMVVLGGIFPWVGSELWFDSRVRFLLSNNFPNPRLLAGLKIHGAPLNGWRVSCVFPMRFLIVYLIHNSRSSAFLRVKKIDLTIR